MSSDAQPWYVTAFAADYLARYAHRSDDLALAESALILAELRLPENARVLDLCCGAGRHTRALLTISPTPLKVLALDLSADLLQCAAMLAPHDPRICYVRGDMRAPPLRAESLDGALNIFTSFGYFDTDGEHSSVLDGVARALKPGARFFMDFFNPAPVIAGLPARTEKRIGGVTVVEERTYDARLKRVCKRIEETGPNTKRVLHESVRAYSSRELENLLAQAGFEIVSRYGDFARAPFDPAASPRCILVARKSGALQNAAPSAI
jgi:ubiquinone/menaquinone biosynthesis C-methylase UbiE